MKIRFLHLSDLHFTCSRKAGDKWATGSFNADFVTKSLVEFLKKRSEEVTFDFIIITGDLAFSGEKDQYEVVKLFCNNLLTSTYLTADNLFIVPGNHDVMRSSANVNILKYSSLYTDQDAITSIIQDPVPLNMYTSKFDNFNEFANEQMGHNYFDRDNFWYQNTLYINKDGAELSINLFGLNSALFAGYDDDDKEKLALGLYQVRNALEAPREEATLSIAFFHHPFKCFHESDLCSKNLLFEKTDIILTGHLHSERPYDINDPAGKVLCVQAGATYLTRTSKNSFNEIEIDLNVRERKGRGRIYFYKYLPDFHTWIKNNEICPRERDGIFPFEIDLSLKHIYVQTRQGIPRKYLRWLNKTCSSIDIKGFTGTNKSQAFRIDDFYIPLTIPYPVAQQERDERIRGINEDSVALETALQEKYLTIIGDPGAGKTTFLRKISFFLSDALLKGQDNIMNLPKDILPVFIRIRKLVDHIQKSEEKRNKDCPNREDSPDWIFHYLEKSGHESNWDLQEGFFKQEFKKGNVLLMLDGLDESPDEKIRTNMSSLITNVINAYEDCRIVVTTRPKSYEGIQDFNQVIIQPLGFESVKAFLFKWAKTLRSDIQAIKDLHLELVNILNKRPEIKDMTENPVMLTAIAVIYWNQKRLPNDRRDLYHSIIQWLLESRDDKLGRVSKKKCEEHLQDLALAMQMDNRGIQYRMGRRMCAERIEHGFEGKTELDRIKEAENFLFEEELDSGIILNREGEIEFWHRSFQEYCVAAALAGKLDQDQEKLLFNSDYLFNSEWREVILLYSRELLEQGKDKLSGFLENIIRLAKGKSLSYKARLVGLIGSIINDIGQSDFSFQNEDYISIQKEVLAIFDRDKYRNIPVKIRCEAADALDPTIYPYFKDNNLFVMIPACTFYMGAQKIDPNGPNYDLEADEDESPVHKVTLSSYEISRYPVTVREYAEFINAGGYNNEEYWEAGGFGQLTEPENWINQLKHPNRPVIRLRWFEAKAYAKWMNCDLPTEAQWERAARGSYLGPYPEKEYKYPWGNKEPDEYEHITNWKKAGLGHISPVGMFVENKTEEGIFDLSGNVWEWCRDWKDVGFNMKSIFYEQSNNSTDPVNDENGPLGKVVDIIPNQIDIDWFEIGILSKIFDDNNKKFIQDCYTQYDNKGAFWLKDLISDENKEKLSDILKSIGYTGWRVLRGCSYAFLKSRKFRCTYRDHNFPDNYNYNFGFRLVRNSV
jgi:formylglycine-generating enzyme required for sulfatase activity/predicted phosphodiesterase